MSTINDDLTFNGSLDFASASGAGVVKVLAGAFVLADISAGTKVFTTLPAGAVVLGASLKATTQLASSNGGTTGVTVEAGTSGDDDGWLPATQMSGSTGYKYPGSGGAMIGAQVAGGSGSFTLTFAATGGAPDLAHITAGAGTVYLFYSLPV